MRWLLVGAFPYPHHQGSQAYLREQARALRAAGVEVELLTYATRVPEFEADPIDATIPHHRPARWTAPSSLASGPNLAKPLADLALSMTLRRLIASSLRQERPYDAVLTHNIEAALAALMACPRHPRPPLIYCAHTLLGSELPHYLPARFRLKFPFSRKNPTFRMPRPAPLEEPEVDLSRRATARLGRTLDRAAARHTDGWIALTQSSSCVMKDDASGPGERIGPPIPDLRARLQTEEIEASCRRHGVRRRGYVLYAGNLDGYQALDRLATTARTADASEGPSVVVASHDPAVREAGRWPRGIAGRFVRDEREMLALLAGARASVVPRTSPGGYPIKLANSLALGVPPITLLDEEWDLVHGESAWLASGPDPGQAIAGGIERLLADETLADTLAEGARALYERQLDPTRVAARTIELVEGVARGSRAKGVPALPARPQTAGSVSRTAPVASPGSPSNAFSESTKPSASSKRSATG